MPAGNAIHKFFYHKGIITSDFSSFADSVIESLNDKNPNKAERW